MIKKPKVLIISQALAPAVGGSPILINNLFSNFKGDVKAISGFPGENIDYEFKTPFETIYFNPPQIPVVKKFINKYHDYGLKYFHKILIWKMVKFIRKYKPDIIFSHYPAIDYFICAYQASKITKVPFYAHMHDLWSENFSEKSYIGKMALKWEKEILTNSTAVFCMTDIQQLHYEKKFGIKTQLLPHSIPDEDLIENRLAFNEKYDNTIIFTGSISSVMNIDALKVFSVATKIIKNEIKVIFCSATSHSVLKENGIDSSDWELKWLSRNKVQELQKNCGILFAPLSHKNAGMDEVKTVFSTKLLEYLISGRPILIFAPPDSFHAISAKKYGWALVVDSDDHEILGNEIRRLFNDIELQKEIVKNAFIEAQRRRASIYGDFLGRYISGDSNL
jgi:glycosyltransferase involved in cell wall biosynthesis